LTPPSLSIVVPLWNEAGNIEALAAMLASSAAVSRGDAEAVLVNNGSTDQTGALLDLAARKYGDWLRPIHLPQNQNYGGGVYEGARRARGALICYLPGDMQYLTDDLNVVAALLLEHYRRGETKVLVKGDRTKRLDSFSTKFASVVYTSLANIILGLNVRDVNGLPKGFHRHLLDLLPERRLTTFVFDAQIIAAARTNKWKVVETPVTFHARRAGVSSWSGKRIRVYMRSIGELLVVRSARSSRPAALKPVDSATQ
jgi:glycosyltransferase involved in cell wall biosynthesis